MPRAKTYGHATALLSSDTERWAKGDAVEMVCLSKEKLSAPDRREARALEAGFFVLGLARHGYGPECAWTVP